MSITATETLTNSLAAATLNTAPPKTTNPLPSDFFHPTNIALNLNTISFAIVPCTDYDRVQKFYGDVFDWTFTPGSPEAQEDETVVGVLWHCGRMNGGFMKIKPENFVSPAADSGASNNDIKSYSTHHTSIGIRLVLPVESIEEKIEKIQLAGGGVYLPKRKIPHNMGHNAYFTDSEGNVLGLWSAH